MKNDLLIYTNKKTATLHVEEVLYVTITPSHHVYFETVDGRRGECNSEDIQTLECDKRETMM